MSGAVANVRPVMHLEIGDVAAMPLRGGGFGACVVLGMPGDRFIVGALAWRSESLPLLAELASAALQSLSVDGVRRSTAKLLKTRYRGSGLDLSVRGAKTDDWLAANLTNPFRDWIEDDRRAATAACKAYATALRMISQLNGASPEPAEAALQAFVEALNLIDERHDGFIDTIRREEAYDAFHDLTRRAGIDQEQTDEWFDTWRDF